MSKNIVEAFKEFNKQLIIIVSGLSGSGKTSIGESISNDFKIDFVDTKKFCKQNFDEKAKLPNETFVVNYDTDNAMEWDDISKKVNDLKAKGVVVVGNVFPTEQLQFNPDYHIHIKLSKQEMKAKRLEYINKHPEKGFDITVETLRFNSLTLPYYYDTLKRMKIDKFIDATNMSIGSLYDTVFDDLIKYIEDKLTDMNPNNKKQQYSPKQETNKVAPQLSDTYTVSYIDTDSTIESYVVPQY